MKKAIEFLRSKGVAVTESGFVISPLPEDENGISLVDELEEFTTRDFIDDSSYCYTVILDQVTKIDC